MTSNSNSYKYLKIQMLPSRPYPTMQWASTEISRYVIFGKQIPPKEIPSGTGEPLKETKKMIEDENDKQVRIITGDKFNKKEMSKEKN